jgi:hypothetical protein
MMGHRRAASHRRRIVTPSVSRLISAARSLVASVVFVGASAGAWAGAGELLDLKCAGELVSSEAAPGAQTKLSFETTIPFGDGRFIALSDPETGKIEKLLYDWEVLTGSFQIERDSPQTIVWTRAMSRRGDFAGQVIGSDGEIFSLAIGIAPTGSAERPFVLFSAAAAGMYRGRCT